MPSWTGAAPRGLLDILLVASLALAVLVLLAACSPLTLLNGAVPDAASRATSGVAYGPLPRQRLDIYAPPDADRAPVVVFFYGGSWRSGDRADYRFAGDALASRGIVAVIADYRLYPEARYPTFLQDAAQVVAWTQQHIGGYGGDPGRVFVAGHSAGGYIAAMLALDPRWLHRAGGPLRLPAHRRARRPAGVPVSRYAGGFTARPPRQRRSAPGPAADWRGGHHGRPAAQQRQPGAGVAHGRRLRAPGRIPRAGPQAAGRRIGAAAALARTGTGRPERIRRRVPRPASIDPATGRRLRLGFPPVHPMRVRTRISLHVSNRTR
jgi:poly(3-hydroxybutyrate) depolymerase